MRCGSLSPKWPESPRISSDTRPTSFVVVVVVVVAAAAAADVAVGAAVGAAAIAAGAAGAVVEHARVLMCTRVIPSAAVESWPAAAIAVEDPYCSCRLTRLICTGAAGSGASRRALQARRDHTSNAGRPPFASAAPSQSAAFKSATSL